MPSLNRVELIGHVGQDPTTKEVNETTLTKFSMATTSFRGEQEHTDWHNIACFGKTAEVVAKYVRQGSMVYVEGRLSTRSWEKDGKKQYYTEVVAYSVLFLDSRKKREESGQTAAREEGPPPAGNEDDTSDLPF